ncbi:MAG: c-type cytochrome [Planctomycetes bacterium]|nr:c-type cytochrome [Planctomycetota bacterium]
MSGAQLVAELESPNSWSRITAQRLLWERRDKSVTVLLRQLVKSSKSPLARLHALYTLRGLESLTPSLLLAALDDAHPGVRRHAVRLSEGFLDSSAKLFTKLVGMTGDSAYRVGLQLAFSLGESNNEKSMSTPALSRLLRRPDADSDMQYAVLTSVSRGAERLATQLLADKSYLASAPGRRFLANLIRGIGSKRETRAAVRLLNATFTSKRDPAVERLVLSAIGSGLLRRGSTLSRLLDEKSVHETVRNRVRSRFRAAGRIAANPQADAERRLAAVKLLAYTDFTAAVTVITQLLGPQTPQSIQRAAVESLAAHRHERIPRILLSRWRSFSPVVRRTVIDELLTRRNRIDALLLAVKSGKIPRREISLQKRQLLMNHPLGGVRAEARKIFVDGFSSKRAKVIESYQKTDTLAGSEIRGQKVFAKSCAVCHRVGNAGHAVGPDLASVRNKSPADLLLSILDPNREAQPNFTVYTVLTKDGKIANGIIAAETAGTLTLRRAEGKQDVILRTNIDELLSSGKSLMPEGLEKDVSPQQMADVIRFIRTLKPPEQPAEKKR